MGIKTLWEQKICVKFIFGNAFPIETKLYEML